MRKFKTIGRYNFFHRRHFYISRVKTIDVLHVEASVKRVNIFQYYRLMFDEWLREEMYG